GKVDLVWLDDADGLLHLLLRAVGVDAPPPALRGEFMDLSWWDWLSGPSVALSSVMILATWTTTGTFMLMFLAGLQNVPEELDEAAAIDGASARQRFFSVTLPLMKPTLFLV